MNVLDFRNVASFRNQSALNTTGIEAKFRTFHLL